MALQTRMSCFVTSAYKSLGLKEHKITAAQLRPVAEWRKAELHVERNVLVCDGTDAGSSTVTDCWPWSGYEWLIASISDAPETHFTEARRKGNTSAPDERSLGLRNLTKVNIQNFNER